MRLPGEVWRWPLEAARSARDTLIRARDYSINWIRHQRRPEPRPAERRRQARRWLVWGTAAVSTAILMGAAALIIREALYPGPPQPIPFSHRIHAQTKDIDCFFCHSFATRSPSAGMPSVDKCLLCHNVIAREFPPIARIREFRNRGESIPWRRVNRVPDFVRFSHQIHLSRRIDCGECHGDVRAMDRVRVMHNFDMDFCVNCHWDSGASVDCCVCHY